MSKKIKPVESEDAKLLRNLLKLTTGDSIAKTISDSLTTTSPENLRALKEVLGPLFEEALKPLHCVRCHLQYIQSGNHDKACLVKCHDDPMWNQEDRHDEEDGYYEMICCGKTFEEFEDPDDICFKTSHTTNSKEVIYRKGKQEDKKAGLDLSGVNDVVTCRVNGCKTALK